MNQLLGYDLANELLAFEGRLTGELSHLGDEDDGEEECVGVDQTPGGGGEVKREGGGKGRRKEEGRKEGVGETPIFLPGPAAAQEGDHEDDTAWGMRCLLDWDQEIEDYMEQRRANQRMERKIKQMIEQQIGVRENS